MSDPTLPLPNPNPQKPGIRVPTLLLVGMLLVMGLLLFLCVVFASNNAFHGARALPAPEKTVVVHDKVKVAVPVGISNADFNACGTAYGQVLDLLNQQTQMVSDVSTAASDAITAMAAGDSGTVDGIIGQVSGYASTEQGLQGQIDSIDGHVCDPR